MIVGIIKPKGPSSHAIISRIRRITGVRRVGHAGTLDPAASGVLVVAIGREDTKKLATFVNDDKEYVAEITLGAISSTDDGEGIINMKNPNIKVSIEDITAILPKFVGEIIQVPPAFSAIKLSGKKAYELARKGKEVLIQPRKVRVYSIEVLSFAWPILKIKVHCGKGVYIRSLARDIGKALGTGGYMSALTRVRVGKYRLEECMTIEQFERYWQSHSNQKISG